MKKRLRMTVIAAILAAALAAGGIAPAFSAYAEEAAPQAEQAAAEDAAVLDAETSPGAGTAEDQIQDGAAGGDEGTAGAEEEQDLSVPDDAGIDDPAFSGTDGEGGPGGDFSEEEGVPAGEGIPGEEGAAAEAGSSGGDGFTGEGGLTEGDEHAGEDEPAEEDEPAVEDGLAEEGEPAGEDGLAEEGEPAGEDGLEEEDELAEEELPEDAELLDTGDTYFYVGAVAVPAEGEGVYAIEGGNITSGMVSFDYDTNTLTLDNAVITHELSGDSVGTQHTSAIATDRFDTLTVKLAGTNTVSVTYSGDSIYTGSLCAISAGGSLAFTSDDGSGTLDVTAGAEGSGYWEIYGIRSNGSVGISNCTVNAQGRHYGIYGNKGIDFGAGAVVTAIGVSQQAIRTYADKNYKVTHNPIEIDMTGYAAVDDETGTALNRSSYSYDYYGTDELSRYHRITVRPREAAGNIVKEGSCGADGDNVTYTLTDEGVLTVSGTGAMADYEIYYGSVGENSPPWYTADTVYVTSIVIGEGVTYIGKYSFYNCTLATEVSLPSTLTSIGDCAFYSCKSLPEITFPAGLVSIGDESFSYNDALTQVTLPDSVQSIGGYAFSYCGALQGISIGTGVTSIGNGAFSYCGGLTGPVTIPAGVTRLNGSTFRGCEDLAGVTLPAGLTRIDWSVFEGCRSLTSIEIPSAVTYIGEDAFSCSGLVSIVLPDAITALPQGVFENCEDLESVHLPTSLQTIDRFVFENCKSLDGVVFPDGLQTIDREAFKGCTSLTEVILPDSVTHFNGTSVFTGCTSLVRVVTGNGLDQLYGDFAGCTSLTDVTIGTGITRIGSETFKGCTSLETIVFPDNVRNAWDDSGIFENCTNLKNVTLSKNLWCICNSMFHGCTSLKSIELPESITKIGSYAFMGCTALTGITFPSANLTSIGDCAFQGCTLLTAVNMPADMRITVIPYAMFENCSALEEITIPASVRGFGGSAFCYCSSLRTVNYSGVLDNCFNYDGYAVGGQAFAYCPELTQLTFTAKDKDTKVQYAFQTLPTDAVHIYGIPGGTLESGASTYNYTFHPVGFTVHFDANGGEGEMEDMTIDYSGASGEVPDAYYFTQNAFTNGGLTFLYWNTKADGSGTRYEDGAQVTVDAPSSGTLTLYAQWAEAYGLWIGGRMVHSRNKDDLQKAADGTRYSYTPSTYDPSTNTIYLNQGFYIYNYMDVVEGAGPERYSGLYYAGTRELTIVVRSQAQFSARDGVSLADVCGIYTAGPLRIVFERSPDYSGNPQLSVSAPQAGSGFDTCGVRVGGSLTVSTNGLFNLGSGPAFKISDGYAQEGNRSIALKMAGGDIRMQGAASLILNAASSSHAANALYLESDTTLRASNWSGQIRINGNGNSAGAVGGASGVNLKRKASECDVAGYILTNCYGDADVWTEASRPVSALGGYQSFYVGPVNHMMSVALAEPARTYVYTGSPIRPAVIVTCGGSVLREGTDYTVKYANNKAAFVLPDGTDNDQEGFLSLPAATLKKAPKIKVTGKGNFTGPATVYFEIAPKSMTPGDTADGTLSVTAGDLTIASGAKAAPVVYYGAYRLTAKDYTMDPAAAAKYTESGTLTLTGKGNFTDSVEIPVTVVAKSEVKNIGVTFGKLALVYDGTSKEEEIRSAITVYDAADKTGKADIGAEHYRLSFSADTVNAGKVKVTATGINGYSGTKTAVYTIAPNKTADVWVYNSTGSIARYRGSAVTCGIYVLADLDGLDETGYDESIEKYETLLQEGRDFKVAYKNNNKVSTAKAKATFTVSFIGNYKGMPAQKGTFTITPGRIASCYASSIPDAVYTKSGTCTAVPYITTGYDLQKGPLLQYKKDFTISYYRSVNYRYNEAAGTYIYEFSGPISAKKTERLTDADFGSEDYIWVYAKITGAGNYKSDDPTDYIMTSFRVRKLATDAQAGYRLLDISKATVTLTTRDANGKVKKVTSFPYTGNPITFDTSGYGSASYAATITVTYKLDKKTTLTLQPGYDYNISYYNNVNKGKATVMISGRSNARYFYDDQGNSLGRIGFAGQKASGYTITSVKLAYLLNLIAF